MPVDNIGEASATRGAAGSITDLSISNWKTEIRNALANLRRKRQSDIMEGKKMNPFLSFANSSTRCLRLHTNGFCISFEST